MSNPENSNNRKEEILAKSRASSNVYNDEGIKNAQNKGTKLGVYYAGTIVGVPLLFLSFIAGETPVVFALLTLFFAFSVGEFIPLFRFTKQKRYMIASVILAIIGAYMALLFVANLENLPESLVPLQETLENLLIPGIGR